MAGDFTVNHSAANAGGTGWVNVTHRILSRNPEPVAGFTAAPPIGNTTTTIQFTDTSTGTNITGWSWGFGDGDSSLDQNPAHTYASCGSESCIFTVNHSAVDSAGAPWGTTGWRSETGPFTIFANLTPNATFTGAPLTGTWPLEVSFTATRVGAIAVDSWHWDFGEGNTSLLQNPVHVYQDHQTYKVTLTATNFTLGQDVVAKPGYIHVTRHAPGADFTWDVSTGTRPLQVQFTDISTNQPDTWFWDFGDGETSILQNPMKTYNAAGKYSVSLRAGNEGGNDWENKTALITVGNPAPTADFTAAPSAGNTTTPIQFTDTSTGTNITGWRWEFGDGVTSQDQNPVHTYASCGSESCAFTVNHAAIDGAGTPWSGMGWRNVTGPFTIFSNLTPNVSFTGTPLEGTRPLEVSFTGTPAGAIRVDSWRWDFGDGNTSALQNPVHVFQNPGTYEVVLTATNFTLGQDVVAKPGYVYVKNQPPAAGFTWDVSAGTRPLQVRFTDTSTDNPDTWYWDFGDGSGSTDQNPVKSYVSAGQFSVSLRAGNDGGDDWENKTALVTVRNPAPTVDFTADSLVVNLSTAIRLTDASTGTNITGWIWDFGDGITSSLQNPAHTYLNTGSYPISLSATDSEGTPWNVTTALSIPGYIRVVNNSITPDFSADPVTGTAPVEVSFTDTSTGGPVENGAYRFGDGTASIDMNPVHEYQLTGAYTVNHSACNDAGCFWVNRTGYITITLPPPPPTPKYYIQISGGGIGIGSTSSASKSSTSEGSTQGTESATETAAWAAQGAGEAQGTGGAQGAGDAQGAGSTGTSSGSGSTGSGGGHGSQGTGGSAGRVSGIPQQGQPQPASAGPIPAVIDTLGNIVAAAGNLLEYLQGQLGFLFGR
jgi:PKD repeat protein